MQCCNHVLGRPQHTFYEVKAKMINKRGCGNSLERTQRALYKIKTKMSGIAIGKSVSRNENTYCNEE